MTDRRSSRPHLSALAVVAVLLVGLAAGFFLAGGRGAEGGAGALPTGDAVDGARQSAETTGTDPAGVPPLEPLEARADEEEIRRPLARFLQAEATGDYETSFGLLSQVDRERYGVVAQWTQAHADLPPITSAEVTDVGNLGGAVVGRSDLKLDSTLNTFVGLVPARAVGTWSMVEEEGGWRVRFSESTLRGSYPPDEEAVTAARTWAAAYAEQCRRPRDPAYDGPLYGSDFLLDDLCGAREVSAQGAQPLAEGAEAAPFVAAFGAPVYGWARVVPVMAAEPLRLVLAPVGDRWSVIGILEP